MRIYSVSKDDTNIIKGVGILLIVLHNYFHWISPSPGENEFTFNASRIFNLFHDIVRFPTESLNILFSYFGHFGVQLFIFISGYGLTVSMLKRNRSWGTFVIDRLKKIYPLILTGIVFLCIFNIIVYKQFITTITWKELAYKCLFIHTLLPHSGLQVIGPWWFFGLIVQLYLIFPFVFRFLQKNPNIGFLCICLIAYTFIFISQYFFQDLTDVPFLENAPGHLPEFCLGIWFALKKDDNIPTIFLPIAIIVFSLGNFFHCLYPFTFLTFTIIFLFIHSKTITPISNNRFFNSFFSKVGALSMLIFVIHAPFRDAFTQFFDPLGNAGFTLLGAIAYTLSVFGAAVGVQGLHSFLVNVFGHIPTPTSTQNSRIEKAIIILLLAFYLYVIIFYIKTSKFSNNPVEIHPEITISDTITTNENYYNISKYVFTDNPHTYIVNIAFDYQSLNGENPGLVISMGNKLWEQFKLTNTTDSCFTHFEYSYKYHRPVIQSLKGEKISFFFWTHNKVEGIYKNLNLTIEEY